MNPLSLSMLKDVVKLFEHARKKFATWIKIVRQDETWPVIE